VSFLESAWAPIARRRRAVVAAFVALSLGLFLLLGRPVRLLILAGALNGLVLPATLLVTLLVARRPGLLAGYRHPRWLATAGWVALAVAAAAATLSLGDLRRL
jgi:Mn2+/Fe2+ NRAMP family transporter